MRFKWNVNLNTRLFSLVGLASLLIVVVIGLVLYTYFQIHSANVLKDDLNRVAKIILATRVAEKAYLQFYTPELKQEFTKIAKEAKKQIANLAKRKIDNNYKERVLPVEEAFKQYEGFFNGLVETHNKHFSVKAEMPIPMANAEKLLTNFIYNLEDKQEEKKMRGDALDDNDVHILEVLTVCKTQLLDLQKVQLQFLTTGDEKYTKEYRRLSSLITDRSLAELHQYATVAEKTDFIKTIDTIKKAIEAFLNSVDISKELYEEENNKTILINQTGEGIITVTDTLLTQVGQDTNQKVKRAAGVASTLVGAGIVIFWIFSYLLVTVITRPTKRVIKGLSNSGRQVGLAAGQFSTVSRKLSEGTSEQAAALEESSSSLSEMASRTKQNAENTNYMKQLMRDAQESRNTANLSMENLSASMEEIVQASTESSKIVKSIDDIAFQTNLLALNAAVEAARVGEAGAGFAVVADEVRALAMRATEAAQNTSQLIETTMRSVESGVKMADETKMSFSKESAIVQKLGGLVDDITSATIDQSQGIEQINTSVGEMDAIAQQNAVHAEESASAAVEMSTQADDLSAFVDELTVVIDGANHSGKKGALVVADSDTSQELIIAEE